MDLAAATDRPGCNADFYRSVDVGHVRFSLQRAERSTGELVQATSPLPPPMLIGSGSTGRGVQNPPLSSIPFGRSPERFTEGMLPGEEGELEGFGRGVEGGAS
jgi:hypothetical protein